MGKDLRIAGVGRLGAEHDGSEARATEQFVHERELQLAVTLAAEMRPEMAGPQATRAHLGLQRPHQFHKARVVDVPLAAEQVVERLDFVLDEMIYPVELLLEIGVSGE